MTTQGPAHALLQASSVSAPGGRKRGPLLGARRDVSLSGGGLTCTATRTAAGAARRDEGGQVPQGGRKQALLLHPLHKVLVLKVHAAGCGKFKCEKVWEKAGNSLGVVSGTSHSIPTSAPCH